MGQKESRLQQVASEVLKDDPDLLAAMNTDPMDTMVETFAKPTKWTKYRNGSLGFEICYPNTWIKGDITNKTREDGVKVFSLEFGDMFNAKVFVKTYPFDKGVTQEEFTKKEMDEVRGVCEKTGAEIKDHGAIKFMGQDNGYFLVVNVELEDEGAGMTLKTISHQVWIVNETSNRSYELVFSIMAEYYHRMMPVVERFTESMVFYEKTAP